MLPVKLLLAFASCSFAWLDHAYRIPDDHILWGPMGKPRGTSQHVRRATSSESSSASKATNTAFTGISSSKASSPGSSAASSTKVPDASCTNGPLTRACWGNGFSIATDFDEKWPNTGRTLTFNWEITNTTCDPDGNGPRVCLLVNNQYPGPTIIANWGDTIVVNVKNSMPNNGTSIHWHGIRQLNTVTQDGVNGITECPLAPGDSKTYTFLATQFG
jgi:Multicopper oxidase